MKLQQIHSCPMKWEQMTNLDERTKFCQLCTKKIHDFSNASNEEIRDVMKGQSSVCAKVPVSKLQESITPFQKVLLAMVICFSGTLFTVDFAYGQELSSYSSIQEKDSVWTIKGNVKDDNISEGLIGVRIRVENQNFGTLTDLEGNFVLEVPTSLGSVSLSIEYIGYKTEKIQIQKKDLVQLDPIILKDDMDAIVIGVIITIDPDSGFERNSIEDLFQREKYLPGF